MNLAEMDLKSLKALAYDYFVQLEVTQKNLQLINAEITKKMKEVKDDTANTDNSGVVV